MRRESVIPSPDNSKDTQKKRLFNLPEVVKILLDKNYFQVDPTRAYDFLYLEDRSNTKSQANLRIPIGKHEWMVYSGNILGGVSDRPISSYQTMLFPDVFSQPVYSSKNAVFTVGNFLKEAKMLENPEPEFGGFDEVFKPGNVVLDIASGEAVADVQLSIKFPQVTIVGTDILYQKKKRIYPKKHGLQLTKADWRELSTIPNNSIDAILSVQGIAMWGLPGSAGEHEGIATEKDGYMIIRTLNRVSKPGTILRLDSKNEFLFQNIGPDWEISKRTDVFIARRKNV